MPDQIFLTTWNNYLAAWSDVTAEERALLLHENVYEQCTYSDPLGEERGIDGAHGTVSGEISGLSLSKRKVC
jgi:hypothetical protein